MVSAVAMDPVASVVAAVAGIIRAERAQPEAAQQFTPDGVEDARGGGAPDQRIGQRDGEDLIRAQVEFVSGWYVDDVRQIAQLSSEKALEKTLANTLPLCLVGRSVFAAFVNERRQATQDVVPERLDLDRLADPRRDDPVTHFGVHPGELNAVRAGPQQAVVRVNADSVPRS